VILIASKPGIVAAKTAMNAARFGGRINFDFALSYNYNCYLDISLALWNERFFL